MEYFKHSYPLSKLRGSSLYIPYSQGGVMAKRLAIIGVILVLVLAVLPPMGQSPVAPSLPSLEGAARTTMPAMPRTDATSGLDPWGGLRL